MSEEEKPPQPQPGKPLAIEQPCPSCGNVMQYRFPIPRIFNQIDVSVIAIAHTRPDRCAKCGALWMPMIKGFSEDGVMEFQWVRVNANKGPMVVGATDSDLQSAIEKAQFSESLKKSN